MATYDGYRLGELCIHEADTLSKLLVTSYTYYKITGWTIGAITGAPHLVADGTAGTFTVGDNGAGLYQISVNVSFITDKATNIHGAIFVNGVEHNHIVFKSRAALAWLNVCVLGFTQGALVAGDEIDFRMKSTASDTLVTFDHGNTTMLWIA